jgi:hypothetical protein
MHSGRVSSARETTNVTHYNMAVKEAVHHHHLPTAEMQFYCKKILKLLEWWQNAMIVILYMNEQSGQI